MSNESIIDRLANMPHDPIEVRASVLSEYTTAPNFQSENDHLLDESRWRWLLRNRTRNGLVASGAIVSHGRKLFVHRGRFAQWFAMSEEQPERLSA